MEGPMLIDNVSVVNNTFVGTADGDHNVHPSSQVIASLPCVLNILSKNNNGDMEITKQVRKHCTEFYCSKQATHITVSGNQPHKAAPIPNNITAFCSVGKDEVCRSALAGSTSDFKCSADYEHVEQRVLPPGANSVHIDALHVDAQGNGHNDVSVRGVVYSDENGQPGDLLGTTEAVVIKADATRAFVRLPFHEKGGFVVTAKDGGRVVWIGEQAGSSSVGAKIVGSKANNVEPPGPLDLACYGFSPSQQHRACVYTRQPFASMPKQRFGPASVCTTSLSIFATMMPENIENVR